MEEDIEAARKKEEEDMETGRKKEEAMKAARKLPLSCGFQWHFSSPHLNQHFRSALSNASDIAVTSDFYFICKHGGSSTWYNVPKFLDNKVNRRQLSLPPPIHVSLGCGGQYAILFEDGDWETVGPDDLAAAMNCGGVAWVELGEYEVWCVLYKDGRMAWSAGLPKGLHNQLNSRNPRLPKAVVVSMGGDGEWFVAYADKSIRCGGYGDHVQYAIDEAEREGGTIRRIVFGDGGAYCICYE